MSGSSSDYPVYKQSVSIQPVGAPDVQSGFRQAAAGIQQFTNAVSKGLKQSEDARLNAQATDQSLDLRKQIFNVTNNVLNPKNFNAGSLDTFDSRASAVINGYMQNVDPRIKHKVQNAAEYYAFSQRTQVAEHVRNLDQSLLQFQYEKDMDDLKIDGGNAAYKAGMSDDPDAEIARDNAAKFKAKGYQLTNDAMLHGIISGKYAETQHESFGQMLQEETYMGGMREALQNGTPQDYIDKFNSTKHADMTQERQTAIALKLESHRTQYEQAKHITVDGLKNEYNDQLLRTQAGDSSGNAAVIAKARQWFPGQADQIERELETAAKYAALTQATKYQDPLSAAKTAATYAPDPKSANLAVNSKYYDAALQQIEKNQKAFADDPAGYITANQNIVNADRNYKMYGDGDPAQAKIALQKQMGASLDPIKGQAGISLVPKAAAVAAVGQMFKGDAKAELDILEQVKQEFDPLGKNTSIILKDLNKNGLPEGTNMAYAMSTNPDSKAYLPQMFDALNEGRAKLMDSLKGIGITKGVFHKHQAQINEADVTQLTRDYLHPYMDSITGYSGRTTGPINTTFGSTELLAMKLIQTGMKPQDAAKTAADATINNFYNYNTFQGHTFRMPKQASYYNAWKSSEYLLNQVSTPGEKVLVPDSYRKRYQTLSDKAVQNLYQLDVSTTGYIRTTKDNRGIEVVDKDGITVRREDATPYGASFADMDNPMSDFSRSLPNDKALTLRLQKQIVADPLKIGPLGRKLVSAIVPGFGAKKDSDLEKKE